MNGNPWELAGTGGKPAAGPRLGWSLVESPPPAPPPPPPAADRPAHPWAGAGAAGPAAGQLLEPEYADHYHAYVSGKTPRAAGALLTALDPVIDEALKSYAGTEAKSPTLKARAKQLTLDAVRRYDPARAKLRTHLLSHLRGLRRVTERATAGVYVPEQWRLDARSVDATRADLVDELGREPSDAELAARLRLPIERVRKARAVPGVLASSQAGDAVAVHTPAEGAWKIWVDAVYHDLQPVDQVILEHSFGLNQRPVLPANAIARMVNLSPGAVSQRKANIQLMLDEFDAFMGTSREG